MRKVIFFIVSLLVFLSLAACATVQKREKELTAKHPEWSREIISKVAQGLIEVGMTKEQVREALVMPQRYDVSTKGDTWRWVDRTEYTREGWQEFGIIDIFKNDRVSELRHFMAIPDNMTYIEWE